MKRVAERVLSSSAVGQLTQGRVRGKTLILAYHAVIPRDENTTGVGERALYVPQRRFAAQLDAVIDMADVVALERVADEHEGRPRIAITFDDAYQGAVTCAVDELVARGLPATIFVAPGRLDGHVFWWDALAHGRASLDAAVRAHALDVLDGDDERVRAWARDTGVPARDDLPPYARASSCNELIAASKRDGITIGSHSWSHANLARVASTQYATELDRPLAWIRERFGARAISWLAYPYGEESPDVRRAAEAAGYASALRISGGWHRGAEVSPHARPRLNVGAGMTVDGLRARLQGALRA